MFVLAFASPCISANVKPGQFVNVRVSHSTDPLLPRPFSVYNTEGDNVEIIFNVVGKGTACLAAKRPGDIVDVVGPLGNPFSIESNGYKAAILVGGGLGVAPLPMAFRLLRKLGKHVTCLLGARTSSQLATMHLDPVDVATDDGSRGFHGTVVDLARHRFNKGELGRGKIFACGPTPMLKAVAAFAKEHSFDCEVSLEGPMACGLGICQGCPVELAGNDNRYALMCKDGPVFDVRSIRI
jgi:dihydroorotate dehydrogenase electron transfer subunit